MSEPCYSFFLFVNDDDMIEKIGLKEYTTNTSAGDDDRLAFMQSRVEADFPLSTRYPVPDRFITIDSAGRQCPGSLSYTSFVQLQRIGRLDLFEDIFQERNAGPYPLVLITVIIRGRPVVDVIMDLEPSPKGL